MDKQHRYASHWKGNILRQITAWLVVTGAL